jgi:hypothetical protein
MQCRINPNRTRANARYSQCGVRQNSRQQTPLLRQVTRVLPTPDTPGRRRKLHMVLSILGMVQGVGARE